MMVAEINEQQGEGVAGIGINQEPAMVLPQPPLSPASIAAMMEMLQQMQTTLARHDDEIKESIWLYTAREAMEQAAVVTRKVDQLAIDMNCIREKSYEASILGMGGGVTGTGGSADAAGALKLLKSELEGVRTVTRRIELYQCTDALTFHHLREVQRGGRRTKSRVEELERQLVRVMEEHSRELRAVRAMTEQALSTGKRRRGQTKDAHEESEGDSETGERYGHYQGRARQQRSLRRRRAEEGYESDPEQLDAELEEMAVGLDRHATR
jgi:hypothetical protein